MKPKAAASSAEKVILIHDGAIDEYMATMLLFTMGNVDLQGIVIVPGNCLPEIGMQTAWKVQAYLGRTSVPLCLSEARGFNPFPWEYRQDCIKQANVPALQTYGPNPAWPPYPVAAPWLKQFFRSLTGTVTVLCLCPLTPLSDLLRDMPEVQDKIKRLVWMGGAIDVAGNLDPATLPTVVANPYAEWNVFWDPAAVEYVFSNTKFPIFMFPLDITNNAKVGDKFLTELLLKSKTHRYADLAYQSYRAVTGAFYRMWDTTAAAYLDRPGLFSSPQEIQVSVLTSGALAGTIKRATGGRLIHAITEFADLDGFYAYVVDQFSTPS
jgi:purine nucleosidase